MNQLDSNQLITMCTLETSCGFPTQLFADVKKKRIKGEGWRRKRGEESKGKGKGKERKREGKERKGK